jgi:hypothetical protein
MSITLCIIAHSRQHNLEKNFRELYNIDNSLKKSLKIKVFNDFFCNHELISKIQENCKNNNLDFENIILQNYQYFNKSILMSEQPTEYVIKCDEDIYLTTDGWNKYLYDVENIDWTKTGCYIPLITSGIPSVEFFIDLFMNDKDTEFFRSEFSKVQIPNLWGVNYDHLKYSPENPNDFFEQVNQIDHHYKGIHPLRVSIYLQNALVDYILMNPKWKNVNFGNNLIDFKPAYFCNSIYLLPTKFYKEAIEGMKNGKFIMDGFDEVGLNQYISDVNKVFTYNANSVAVHPSYNTIGLCYGDISNKFYANT